MGTLVVWQLGHSSAEIPHMRWRRSLHGTRVAGRLVGLLVVVGGLLSPWSWQHGVAFLCGTTSARRLAPDAKEAKAAAQGEAGRGHQGREPRHELHGGHDEEGAAFLVRLGEAVCHLALVGETQATEAQGRAQDVPDELLEPFSVGAVHDVAGMDAVPVHDDGVRRCGPGRRRRLASRDALSRSVLDPRPLPQRELHEAQEWVGGLVVVGARRRLEEVAALEQDSTTRAWTTWPVWVGDPKGVVKGHPPAWT